MAGLPARRANTLLFLIESKTAHMVARSRVEFSLTETSASERNLAFLEAFALGNAPPLRPTIQDLECYAPQWALLVAANSRLKAAVVHAISQKYKFTHQLVPNIRAVLDLDEAAVQEAYLRLYRKPLETIFASRLSLIEQLRWSGSAIAQRLESLPPFWIASSITVALGLPQAFLALPIAVANIGPLATVAFVIVIGAINILTMACMAEAIGRSGDFRYGNAFIKQLVANYLGNTGSSILSIAVGIRVFLIALACYIGLSATMANFTHISAQIWAALLFFAGLYLLSRKSFNFTVAVMVLLAAINVSLLLCLSFFAFRHVQLDNLLYVNLPFLNGHAFDPRMIQQILGVSLMLYFGHVYVGECAKLVLPRDPSANSLIWGSVAGTAFLTLLFCIWVLAVNGAISPQVLVNQSGTALEPLAQQIGPIAQILGSVLVVLLLGMAWMRSSSLLLNLAHEWFPSKPRPILMLPAKQGRLILHPRGNSNSVPRIGLTYLGLEASQPKFRLDIQSGGNIHHVEITATEHWEIKEILAQFPDLHQWDINLTLDVYSASQDGVCLRLTSPMILVYEGRLGATTAGGEEDKGTRRQTHKGNPTRSPLATVRALLPPLFTPAQLWASLLNQRHFFLSISPLVLVFLLTEWLFLAGAQSFTSVLAFAGVLGNSLVGGIFPVLLLVSSRQKGEFVPGVVFGILNHPFLIGGIYSLFLANLLLHGLVIWKNPVARTSALSVALLSLGATIMMKHSGAFAARVVVELREEQPEGGRAVLNITAGGRPKMAEVQLGYAEGEQNYRVANIEIPSLSALRYAIFKLPTKRIKELRVWAHRGNSKDNCESLPALLEVNSGNQNMQFDLKLSNGQVLLPLVSETSQMKLTFDNS
jgi:hypothetical protein